MGELHNSFLSRRRLLTGATAATFAGLASELPRGRALAEAPLSNTQAPALFTGFKLGQLRGHRDLRRPAAYGRADVRASGPA